MTTQDIVIWLMGSTATTVLVYCLAELIVWLVEGALAASKSLLDLARSFKGGGI